MLTLTFYATNGNVYRGLVIGRSGTMLEVAMDETETRPASIGWVNPTEQIGRVVVNAEQFAPRHPALKDILRGSIQEGRIALLKEHQQYLKDTTK
jgi:hypothetical protein